MHRIGFVALMVMAVFLADPVQGKSQMFEKSKLYIEADQRTFTGESLSEIAFPLGGIGTGTVSLGGRGDLRDWEIFNRPDKGGDLRFTFFAIWAKAEGGKPVAKILERKIMPPYRSGGHGVPQNQLSGVARLDEAVFRGEYPFANIEFKDSTLPVRVRLEAWNPMIPLNVDDSSIPVAIFSWTITNPMQKLLVLESLKVRDRLMSPEAECKDTQCICKKSPGGKKPALSEDKVVPKYQYGDGCLFDQLLGQYLAHVVGLGYVLDSEHVKTAI